jgi:hypothetical protein
LVLFWTHILLCHKGSMPAFTPWAPVDDSGTVQCWGYLHITMKHSTS